MKKMFLTLALFAATTAVMAQQSVTYFRVQFTENLEQVKTYAADGKTFFNPAYDYLDFKGSLPFTHGSLSGNVDENAYYYIGEAPNNKTRFTLAKTDGSLAIKKVSAYSQPVETITVTSEEGTYTNGKKQVTFTFNALPRNIEELKTLEVDNRKYFESQYFVTALFICCLNRIADNSADAWEMINYLRTHTATVGQNGIQQVSNLDMQNIVQSNLVGKDTNGYPVVNGLRSFFAGSSPSNLYTPTTPYKVTVVEAAADPLQTGSDGTVYAKLHVISSGADSAQGPLTLRKTNNHGWLIWDGEKAFTMSKKAQKEDL
jgi:hypothetical protein